MGIKEKIVNVEIDFKEISDREEFTVKESLGDTKNNQKITKIEISSAIFIYRQNVEAPKNTKVDVIPFDQIKDCIAHLTDEEKE